MTGVLWLAALSRPADLRMAPALAIPPSTLSAVRRASSSSGVAGAALLSFTMTVAVLAGVRWRMGGLVIVSAVLAWLLRRLAGPSVSDEPPEDGPGRPGLDVDRASRFGLRRRRRFRRRGLGRGEFARSPLLLGPQGAGLRAGADDRPRVSRKRRSTSSCIRTIRRSSRTVSRVASMAAGRLPWTAAILTFPLLLAALALGLPGLLARGVGPARRRPSRRSPSPRSRTSAWRPTSGATARCLC